MTVIGLVGLASLPASADPAQFLDPGGDTGVDGKSDLNGVDIEFTATDLEIGWYYDDDISTSSNAKAACVDLDTDGDQLVDFAVCYDPDTDTTYLAVCDDSTSEGCAQNGSSESALPAGTCTESSVPELVVADEYNEPTNLDSLVACTLPLSLFGPGQPGILNVCTVQANAVGSLGTSQHKDCALRPVGTGTLTLVKVVANGPASAADFNLVAIDPISGTPVIDEPGPITNPAEVLAGSYALSEVSPLISGGQYQLDSLSCDRVLIPLGDPVIEVPPNGTVTCTFTNSVALQPPALTVIKTAGGAVDGAINEIDEPGGDVTFDVAITNDGGEATIDSFDDDIYPSAVCLDGDGIDVVGQTIAEGETISCSFVGSFEGNAGDSQTDVVTVGASNGAGDDEDSDDAVVALTDVAAVPLSIVKSVTSASSLPESGGDFDFEVVVTNESDVDTVAVSSLDDTFLADLATNGNCEDANADTTAPFVLSPGEAMTCTFTVAHLGDPATFDNVVSVVATDDDGAAVGGDSNEVTVEITDVLPAITVDKSVDKPEVRAPGETVVFTVTITNDSATENVEVQSVSDDVHTTAVCLDGDGVDAVGQSIAPGATLTCSFSAFVDADETDTVTVVAVDDEDNEATDDDQATVNLVVPELTVTKSADVDVVSSAGDEIVFTIEVANGGDTTEVFVVADVLSGGGIADPGLDLMFGPPFTDPAFTTAVIDPGAGLAPGETWYYRVEYTVTPADIDSRQLLTNEACVPDVDGDGQDECDTATVEIQVAELTIVKDTIDDNGGGFMVGDPITWTYLVTNTGTVTVSDIVVTDDDPSVVVSCPTAVLDPGGDMTCSAAGTAVFGLYTNVGTVTGEGPDGGPDPEADDDNSGYNGEYWAFTPGFWKNHAKGKHNLWQGNIACASTGAITTSVTVGDVIDVPADYTVRTTKGKGRRSKVVETPIGELTLLQALSLRGGSGIDGAAQTLLRAATASVLNTCFHETLGNEIGDAGDVWPITLDELVDRVEGALDSRDRSEILGLASLLDSWNNGIDDIDWRDPRLFG